MPLIVILRILSMFRQAQHERMLSPPAGGCRSRVKTMFRTLMGCAFVSIMFKIEFFYLLSKEQKVKECATEAKFIL